MKKNIKIKLLMLVVTLGIFTTGIAFASMDAGTHLKNWYDSSLKRTTKEIVVSARTHFRTSFIQPLEKETGVLITKSKMELEKTGTNTRFHAMVKISNEGQNRIDSIKMKKNKLLGDSTFEGILQQDFSDYSEKVKDKVDKLVQRKAKDVLENLNEGLNLIISNMENDITEYSQKDSEELSDHIDTSKNLIITAIEREKAKTITEITTYIDGQVGKHKKEIIELAEQNAGKQNSIVMDKSYTIENQAKEEMNEIINTIIKN